MDLTLLRRLFLPYVWQRHDEVLRAGKRFVYYTNAETAFQIIRNKEVWLRDASCMNDYMEVRHGLDCLISAWNSEAGKRLQHFLESRQSGLTNDFAARFDADIHHFRHNTFICCVSEHEAYEDNFGRLSMWRAYGKSNGVALVLRPEPFLRETDGLRAYTTPVQYLASDQFQPFFDGLVANLLEHLPKIPNLDNGVLSGMLYWTFRTIALCTKHIGFSEEKEWRVVYSPTISRSEIIKSRLAVVNGVAQNIEVLPLINKPELDIVGISVSEILERIIIGPTTYPKAMLDGFAGLLREVGFSDPYAHVTTSTIPLRQ